MSRGKSIVTYPVKGYSENTIKCAIRAGASKVILLDKDEEYMDLLNRLRLVADVRPILTDDVSLVAGSVANIISEAKEEYDEVMVLLLPTDLMTAIGTYIAACMENVKVLTPLSDFEMKHLTLPLFPFVNLNENEKFVLTKIIENDRTTTKNLFAKIKKDYCSMLYSNPGNSNPRNKERSAFMRLHRALNKLEKIKLINKEKRGKNLILSSTSFGKLVFGQGRGRNIRFKFSNALI